MPQKSCKIVDSSSQNQRNPNFVVKPETERMNNKSELPLYGVFWFFAKKSPGNICICVLKLKYAYSLSLYYILSYACSLIHVSGMYYKNTKGHIDVRKRINTFCIIFVHSGRYQTTGSGQQLPQ